MEGLCLKVLFCFFLLHGVGTLLSACFAKSATILGNETDWLALLAFKKGISGDPNQILSSWNDSVHFCNWFGVTCSKRHPLRVTALDLTSQRLVGSLSPHIGNLSFLQTINLTDNGFHGQIPQEIGRLFRLVHLNLSYNSFSGEIPKNLSHCLKLRFVIFNSNKLEGEIPVELDSLSKLEFLAVLKNNLTGHIPPSLGNFSSLTRLLLQWNNLQGSIPDELGRLASLEFLVVGENNLSGTIPPSVYNLSSLSRLAVVNNHLHGTLPPKLGLVLPNLRVLNLGANQFTGHIPRSLGNASGIALFNLAYNNFIGSVPTSVGRFSTLFLFYIGENQLGGAKDDDLDFITSLTNCSNLQELDVTSNRFSGMIPYSIANLSTQLQTLWLQENQIFGTIPSGLENLASLTTLHMDVNQMTGTIPLHLGKLQNLEELFLSDNELSGQIPESIGNLSRLYLLSLKENKLHGTIPWSLGNCQHLQNLWLYSNKLQGAIPKQLFNSPSLTILNLYNNSLTGSLPTEVGTLKNLERLLIADNRLSGEIPSTLGNCIKLQYLRMEGNFFRGSIPSLSALKGLEELDLSRNNLSGFIPKYFEQLDFLQYLNLSFNDLEGEVPQHGIFQNTSAISITGNIKLCGGIPELHLRTCPEHTLKKQKGGLSLKLILIIVIPIVFCLSLLLYFTITRCWLKQSKKTTSSSFAENPLLEVTYGDLLRATSGFSSTNLIGMGSFGCVYRGIIDHSEITDVAIKVLKLQQPRSSKSFTAECMVLRNVKHRNIVRILTVCSSIDYEGNDFKALIFEFMPNGSLDLWLHPNEDDKIRPLKNLNLIQRINIAIDVAYALDYLHHHCQEPIVHCDLKPSNVLLDNDMVAHVSDFGLARILYKDVVGHSHAQSSTLSIKGSIGYVAPEYGMGGEVSIHGDMYSYGILLLEMLIGKRPTDEMFKDGLSLLQFAKMALPDRVLEIIDHRLLSREIKVDGSEDYNKTSSKIQTCVASLVRIATLCSAESPQERLDMKDVLREIHGVKDIYLHS